MAADSGLMILECSKKSSTGSKKSSIAAPTAFVGDALDFGLAGSRTQLILMADVGTNETREIVMGTICEGGFTGASGD
jgi:hypothetical protein